MGSWITPTHPKCSRAPGLRESLQHCSPAARKWRENEEMKRKWSENEEIERKSRENEEMSFSLDFLSISSFSLHFLFISSFSLHFLAAGLQCCNDSRSPGALEHLGWVGVIQEPM